MATTAFATNNNISKLAGSGKNNELPNLGAVASAVTVFAGQMKQYQEAVKNVDMDAVSKSFINSFKLYTNVIKSLSSVDADVFKKFKSATVINSITQDFKDVLNSLADSFTSMTQHMGQGDVYNKLKEVLTPTKTTKEYRNTNENGIGLSNTETTETGSLIDCVNMILNVYKQMGEIKTNGPFAQMFKRVKNKAIIATFKNDILYVFEEVWAATMTTFLPFTDNRKVQTTYLAIKSLEKVTLSLPALLEKLAEPMIYLGRKYQSKKILKSFEILVGKGNVVEETKSGKAHKDYLVGVVMDMLECFTLIQESYGNSLTKVNKMLGDFSSTLNSLAISMTALGVLAIPVSLGLLVMVGFTGKGGLVGVLTRAMTMLAEDSKDISQASKSLMMMSASILLLTSTAVLISLTGAFVIQSWETIGVTFGFVAGLVVLMWLLGSKVLKNEIQSGAKTILLLSSALALISLTAVMLVMTGQLITADWNSILQVGAMVIGLGVTMWILSQMKDTVLESTKTILLLSLAIGLISLIAVGLVWVSQYLEGNWLTVVLLLVGIVALAGAMWVVSQIGQDIDILAVAVIVIGTLLLSAAIFIVASAAEKIASFGGIVAFIAVIVGMVAVVWIVTGLLTGIAAIPQPILILGVIALGMIAGVLVSMAYLVNSIADSIKTISETAKMIKDEKWGKGKSMSDYLMLPITAMLTVAKSLNDGDITYKQVKQFRRLRKIACYIGEMAKVVKDIASLSIPTQFDKNGNTLKYEKMKTQDFIDAGQNASAVGKVLTSMFSEDGQDVEITVCGRTIKMATINLGDISHLRNRHTRRMNRLALITDSVGKMASVIRDVATLTVPKIDEKTGKQIGVTKMTPEDFENASKNVKTIMETILGVFKDDDLIDAIEDLDEENSKVITAVMDSVGNLSSIMEVLVMIHKNQIPDVAYKDGKLIKGSNTILISVITQNRVAITQRISSLLRMPLEAILTIDEDLIDDASDRVEDLNEVIKCTVDSTKYVVEWYNTTLKSINVDELNTKYEGTNKTLSSLVALFAGKKFTSTSASSFDKQTKSLVNVLKQVNDTDVSKLKYTYSMVSKLAEFAKSIRGDFDKLAECINEDLIEAIEKLNETLNGTSKDINVTTTAQMLPNNSGTDKQSTTAKTNETNALKAQIAELQRQIAELKNAQKPQRLKLDSTGAVVVKIAN